MPSPGDIMRGRTSKPGTSSGGGSSSSSSSTSSTSSTDTSLIDDLRAELGLEPLNTSGTREEEFTEDFSWEHAVVDKIEDDIKAVAKKYDLDLDYVLGWYNGQKNTMLDYIEGSGLFRQAGIGPDPGPSLVANAIEIGRNWIGQYFPGFRDAVNTLGGGRGGGGGGGGGRRRPSAAEIRAQFDIDELTEAVNQMSRGLLLEEASNARSLAEAYVGAIVRNPDQKLDFETFVRGRLLATPRAQAIYKNKPESLTEEQFLQPYVQAAAQRIGPGFGDQLADIAIGGARLAASPGAFQARLNRTRQVQTSAPFLSRLGERISSVKQVLR